MSNEKPILFKDEMIRAILEGRKTQTRRIVKPQPQPCNHDNWPHLPNPEWLSDEDGWYCGVCGNGVELDHRRKLGVSYIKCPYGKPGDRLWVRETWSDVNLQGAPGIAYRADDDIRDLMAEPSFHDEDGAFNYGDDRVKPYHFAVWSEDLLSGAEGRWRPSIHMPRWASRITLEITDVRVERLQDISEKDAEAEGARFELAEIDSVRLGAEASHRGGFQSLWQRINGPDSWYANPWVWVIEFKRIDQEAKAA